MVSVRGMAVFALALATRRSPPAARHPPHIPDMSDSELPQLASNAAYRPRYRYQSEIQQMMFVFGEVADPLPDTTQLVEDICRSQIIDIILQSCMLVQRRGSRYLSTQDVLYCIRHDQAKVSRLCTYLAWKDVRNKAKNTQATGSSEAAGGAGVSGTGVTADAVADAEDVLLETAAGLDGIDGLDKHQRQPRGRRNQFKLPWDVFSVYSDVLGPEDDSDGDAAASEEAQSETHVAMLQRLKDADERTRRMTKDEYVQYSECRQASFTYRKGKKFREWCALAQLVDIRPSEDLIDVLGFLATETVRMLVEIGLSVQDEWVRDGIASVPNERSEAAAGTNNVGLFARDEATPVFPIQPKHIAEAYRRVQQGEEYMPKLTSDGNGNWRPRAKQSMVTFQNGLVRSRANMI